MEIYTRRGDGGQTSLWDGTRLDKDHIRVESYGSVDELGASLGVAKNYVYEYDLYDEIEYIQNKLFILSSCLATRDKTKASNKIEEKDIEYLEELIDKYYEKFKGKEGLIINGSDKKSAHLHMARTICRRAERRIRSLSKLEEVDENILIYINRLSDTLYSMARYSEEKEKRVDFSK